MIGMQQNEDIYYIPVNFTDAGRVLGLFELRNCIAVSYTHLAVRRFGNARMTLDDQIVYAQHTTVK